MKTIDRYVMPDGWSLYICEMNIHTDTLPRRWHRVEEVPRKLESFVDSACGMNSEGQFTTDGQRYWLIKKNSVKLSDSIDETERGSRTYGRV